MERLGQILVCNFWTNRSCKSLNLTVAIMVATVFTPGITSAQLRTGREVRPLYHDRLASEVSEPAATNSTSSPKATAKSAAKNRSTGSTPGKAQTVQRNPVMQASYLESDSQPSILEEPASMPSKPVGSGMVTHEHSPAPQGSYFGPSAAGCDGGCGGGCDACDSFADLAPTCAGTCGVGTMICGPQWGCGPIGLFLSRMSVRAEVPLYWRRAAGLPPLVTTSNPGTAQDLAGELGQATTRVLLGNGPLEDNAEAGFRLTLGTWLRADRHYGLLFRYWNAGEEEHNLNFSSTDNEILARPFLNTTANAAGVQDTQLIAFTNQSTGNISVTATSQLDGVNVFLRRLVYMDRFSRFDWLHGYQYIGLDEGLGIRSNTLVTGNANPALVGASIAVTDQFDTQNDFHGAVNGFMYARDFGRLRFESTFRMGLGNLRRQVNIRGSTTTTSSAGASNTQDQGLLARNTNAQPFVDDTFVVVPEVGLNFGYRLRSNLDFNLGYNYMLIPKVAQASRQIDKQLAANLSDPLAGSLDPQLDFEERKYWIQSLGFGLQWNY